MTSQVGQWMFVAMCLGGVTATPIQSSPTVVNIPSQNSANPGLLSAYVSLSYELANFPEFAGTRASPNSFSVNLLKNIGRAQEFMPVSRVGGNSQDRAIYDPTLQNATAPSCSADPTAILCIGKSFFDSYGSFTATKYSHGFNLAWNNASGYETLQATVPLACKALPPAILETFEYGNEPDLYIGKWRPTDWTEADYLSEWLNGTSMIQKLLQESCPHTPWTFMMPSLSSPGARLSAETIFEDLSSSKFNPQAIRQISDHNYVNGAQVPGVTLQNTLMNHTATVNSISRHVNLANELATIQPDGQAPYILGECNSLYGGGRAGISNVFGSALWVVDFTLYGASTGKIHRMHYHQSATAPYAAWTPDGPSVGTNAPYYGKLAAAQFLGDSRHRSVAVVPLPNTTDVEVVYAGYDTRSHRLTSLAVLNLLEYNATTTSTSSPRPSNTYTLEVPPWSTWDVARLAAAGANETEGITFGSVAYDYSSNGEGRRVSRPERPLSAGRDGKVTVVVANSEAVILSRQ